MVHLTIHTRPHDEKLLLKKSGFVFSGACCPIVCDEPRPSCSPHVQGLRKNTFRFNSFLPSERLLYQWLCALSWNFMLHLSIKFDQPGDPTKNGVSERRWHYILVHAFCLISLLT